MRLSMDEVKSIKSMIYSYVGPNEVKNLCETIEALQQENEHLKKLLRMAQFAMDGMIKTIGTEDEINKYYWWGELQKVSNMINDLEKENEE